MRGHYRANGAETAHEIGREENGARPTDALTFVRSFLTAPLRTGAQWPSSRGLCRAMAAAVDPDTPGPMVELGPGTGVVTQALLERGVAAHRLVLIESNAAFCRLLEQRFPGVRVIADDAFVLDEIARDLRLEPLAAVVSSLPLLTQPPHRRIDLLGAALSRMHANGSFVQFTYGKSSPIPVDPHIASAASSPRIWWNLWPACVWRYRRVPAVGAMNGAG